MEEILASVSTPFSNMNFRNLLELYLKSKNEQEFYYQLVEYHKDKKLSKDKTKVSVKDFDLEKFEHMFFFYPEGGWNEMTYMGHVFDVSHRIYINAPYDVAKDILNYFVSRCTKEKLPFVSKFPDDIEGFNRNDSIVISSNSSVYERHIEILRELARERPDIVEACGTPHLLSGTIDGWLGLSDECKSRYTSPTMQIRGCIREALVVFLKNNPQVLEMLDNEKLINTIKSLDEYGIRGVIEIIDFESKEKIFTLMEKHPEIYEEIYNSFLERCEGRGLRRENPIFYEETPAMLIEGSQQTKKRLTQEMESLLLKADETDILRLLLDERVDEQLDTPDKVKMIERMVSIHMKDIILQQALLDNMESLVSRHVISEELLRKVWEVYGYDSRYGEWEYFSEVQRGEILDCISDRRYKFNGQPANEDICIERIETAEIPIEQKQAKICEALKEMQAYCERTRINKEKMQQRLESLESIREKAEIYYINWLTLLREEEEITRFCLEHADEINELNERISAEIASILYQMEHANDKRTNRKAQGLDVDDDDGEIED